MKKHLVIDASRSCYIKVEKRDDYYRIEIDTDSYEITILCDRLNLIDRRPKPVKPLTSFVKS